MTALDPNPYSAPTTHDELSGKGVVCKRRLDVAAIAFVFAVSFVLSFVALLIPELRNILHPRFGFTTSLAVFPLVHLCMYLWQPSVRALWASAGMTLVVSVLGGVTVWWRGTVAVVANPFTDLLHSAYFFSTIPFLLVSCYLAHLAWSMRTVQPILTDHNDG